jgi:predicted ABC-type ATPase
MSWFWIVAGPNGAGKTTTVAHPDVLALLDPTLIRLNADERTKQILAADPTEPNANLRAAQQIDAEVFSLIEQRIGVLVETVLSSDKYLPAIERAHALGMQVGVVYVGVRAPELSVARVKLRVLEGGHDVPADRIVARWHRSIAMLGRIAPLADRLHVFDNTDPTAGLVLVAINEGDGLRLLQPGRIPAIDDVLG